MTLIAPTARQIKASLLNGGFRFRGNDTAAWGVGVAIFGAGGLLDWLCRHHPAALPPWMPWTFSWPEYLGTAFSLWWFILGSVRAERSARLPRWRALCFLCGVAAIYGVLQTRFDYMAQHMFFLNRMQHVVMHHIGPFLIALSGTGETIRRGMPRVALRATGAPPVAAALRIVQQPVIAVLLFVGLFYLWLIPPIHFEAMIDGDLYAVMNWSMVVDGLLFWTLVLDFRPRPPARLSFGTRAAMAYATTFPEILIGAYLINAHSELYPFYSLCGRVFPWMDALTDQRIGAAIIWVPPAMMGAAATLAVVIAFLHHDEAVALARKAD